MAIASKLGVALLLTLASNATLLSLLLKGKDNADTNTATKDSYDHNHRDGDTTHASHLQSNALNQQELALKVARSAETEHFSGEHEDIEGFFSHPPASSRRRGDQEIREERQQEWVKEREDGEREPRENKQKEPNEIGEEKESKRKVAEGIQTDPEDTEAEEDEKDNDEEEDENKGSRKIQEKTGKENEYPPRTERSALKRAETGHHLKDVIATLTEGELDQLDEHTVKILVPALIGLESLVLRELEKLHDVTVRQELRLERLEKSELQGKEVMEAANVIREEKYLMQRKEQEDALRKQLPVHPPAPQPQPQLVENESELDEASAEIIDFQNATDADSNLEGSGSGDEPIASTRGLAVTSITVAAVNYTESSDSAIINHIYEIYSSITSLEHKVMELGTSLSTVSTELYRQRSTFVRLEDKVEEVRRNQRSLVMRSTMHTFKLADLEQFKGQAEMLLRTAEGTIEQFDAKLEIFKDRVTEQQDEMQTIRGTFGRLEQAANELRASDSYKAHDIQELKRSAHQFETRLSNLYHSLDRYIGNIRWDVKNYLDHLCSSNNLQC